jgi:hypothetical protein
MTMHTEIEDLIQKTKRYEFVDGLRDLQLAVLMAFFGAFVWLSLTLVGMRWYVQWILKLAETFGRWAALISGAFYILILLALLGGTLWVMRFLRRRWLWRESGWVKPLPWQVPRKVNILSAAIMLGGIGLGIGLLTTGKVDETFVLRMFWAAIGWAFGFTLVGVGRELELKRYLWLGSVGGIASTVVLFFPLDFGQTAIVLYGAWALALGISGAITLRRALVTNKRANHDR